MPWLHLTPLPHWDNSLGYNKSSNQIIHLMTYSCCQRISVHTVVIHFSHSHAIKLPSICCCTISTIYAKVDNTVRFYTSYSKLEYLYIYYRINLWFSVSACILWSRFIEALEWIFGNSISIIERSAAVTRIWWDKMATKIAKYKEENYETLILD